VPMHREHLHGENVSRVHRDRGLRMQYAQYSHVHSVDTHRKLAASGAHSRPSLSPFSQQLRHVAKTGGIKAKRTKKQGRQEGIRYRAKIGVMRSGIKKSPCALMHHVDSAKFTSCKPTHTQHNNAILPFQLASLSIGQGLARKERRAKIKLVCLLHTRQRTVHGDRHATGCFFNGSGCEAWCYAFSYLSHLAA
jgi:hypothetical protein